MKRHFIIFSILLVFVLMSVACVNAAEIDDSDYLMMENQGMELSQDDNVDLNHEIEVLQTIEENQVSQGKTNFIEDLQSNEEDQVSQGKTNFIEDLQSNEEDQVSQGKTNFNEDLQEESIDDIISPDDEAILDENDAVSNLADVDDDFQTDLNDSLPDVICCANNLEDFNIYVSYMGLRGTKEGEELRKYLIRVYQEDIPEKHSNTLRLRYDIKNSNPKIIFTFTSGKEIIIDGQGHTIDLAGSDHHDHYFVIKYGNVTFRNMNFINGYNNDGDNGGAISIEDSGVCTVINCTFKNCWAKDTGGAIADRAGNTLTLIDSTFIGNEANIYSGGAVWSKGKVVARNCTFESNLASQHGGGLYCKGYMTVDGCTFKNNIAGNSSYGGGVYANELDLTNATSIFINNSAYCGGGLRAKSFICNISNQIFIGNNALWRGGAIFTQTLHDFTVSSCVFINNKLTQNSKGSYGGALDFEGSSVNATMKNNIFVDNFAYADGNNAYTFNELHPNQNWFGSNDPIFSDHDFSSYYCLYHDKDYLISSYNITHDYKQFDFELRFETKSGNVPDNPLFILKDFVSFVCDEEELEFENLTIEGNVIRVTPIPKVYGNIPFTIKIYDIPLVEDYINITGYDSDLDIRLDDIVIGEENLTAEVFLNKTINGTVNLEFNNLNYTVDILEGYGNLTIPIYSSFLPGTYTVKVFFEGIHFFKKEECSTSVVIKAKTTPEDVCEFITLQNRINHASDELVLDCDYMYGALYGVANDVSHNEGVLISKDNFVIDGQGHTIDGQKSARIFDIRGKNVTIRNVNFVNAHSSNGGAVYSSDIIFLENCTFINNSASNGGAIFLKVGSIIGNCTFINNSAWDGGAIYLSEGGLIENCTFINNSANSGGGIHSQRGSLMVSYSNFTENYAKTGGAISTYSIADIHSSVFLKNKADVYSLDMWCEDNVIMFEFIACNNYINAIRSYDRISFSNVSYWEGRELNSDEVSPESYSYNGTNLTLDIYLFERDELFETVPLVIEGNKSVWIPDESMYNMVYIFKISHMEDDYYTYETANDTFFIFRNSSSVTIDLKYGMVYTYPDCPGNISFDIINQTNFTVVLTDLEGNIIFNQTYDEDSDVNTVLLDGLLPNDYNLTVSNCGNFYTAPSHDTILFKILKQNSTIKITASNITQEYKQPIYLGFIGENITTINLTVYDSNREIVWTDLFNGGSYTLTKLPAGNYTLTVFSCGNATVEKSEEYSINVLVTKVSINALFTATNVTMGSETKIWFRAIDAGTYTVTVSDGTVRSFTVGQLDDASFYLTLPIGNYSAHLAYDDPNYWIPSENITFNVSPISISGTIILRDDNVTYGESVEIDIIVNHDGNYTLNIGELNESIEIIGNHKNIVLEGMDVGNYTLGLVSDDPNYYLLAENITLFINKKKLNDKIVIDNKSFVGKVPILITSDIGSGIYHLRFNDIEKEVMVSDGRGTALLILDPGIYSVSVHVDSNYETSIEDFTFVLPNGVNNVNVTVEDVTYPNSAVIVISADLDGTYLVNINGSTKVVFVEDGTGNTSFFLAPGSYWANASFYDSSYSSHIRNATFDVLMGDRNVSIIAEDCAYGEEAIIILESNLDGIYLINVNGTVYPVYVIDGIGNKSLSLDVGNYSISVLMQNLNYNNFFENDKFEVFKQNSVIYAENKSFVINYGGDYAIVLKDAHGNILSGENVTFILDGRDIGTVTVGDDGTAGIKLTATLLKTAKAGVKDLLIKFDGTSKYNGLSKTIRINIDKEKTNIVAKKKTYVINYGGKYSITLKDSKGKVIANKRITFTLGGKYLGSATTNAKGLATFKFTSKMLKAAKAGKKNLIIKFVGDSYYVPALKTVKLTIKKEKSKLVAKKKTFKLAKKVKKYKVTLKNSKGKPIKKVKVTLRIKGKTYKAKTNKKGKAVFKIKNLKRKGKFRATIKFKGNKYYKKVSKKVKITVKR